MEVFAKTIPSSKRIDRQSLRHRLSLTAVSEQCDEIAHQHGPVTQIAIPCADLKRNPPLSKERSIGFQQGHGRIVDMGRLTGDAVEFENFKPAELELFG